MENITPASQVKAASYWKDLSTQDFMPMNSFEPGAREHATTFTVKTVVQRDPHPTTPSRSQAANSFYKSSLGSMSLPQLAQSAHWSSQQHSNEPVYDQQPQYSNIEALFDDETPESPETIIADLKQQVDVLTTAMMMSETSNHGMLKGLDAAEVAHRVYTRLSMLREENERLAQLVSGRNAAIMEAQIENLRQENMTLKNQIFQAGLRPVTEEH